MKDKSYKAIWIGTWTLLIASVVVDVLWGARIMYANGSTPSTLSLLSEYSINLIAIMIMGSFISVFFAIIPFKKYSFGIRFSTILPIVVSLCCVTYMYVFTSAHFYKKAHPSRAYNLVKADREISCISIKEGSFRTTNLLIERKGNTQVQTDIKTGKKTHYRVNWLGDCEYGLINEENEILKVKIVDVTLEYYDYYSAIDMAAYRGRVWFANKDTLQNKVNADSIK